MNSLLEIGLLHAKADLLCVVGEGKQASISQTLLYISKKTSNSNYTGSYLRILHIDFVNFILITELVFFKRSYLLKGGS